MSTMVAELYDALRKAGADEALARAAASAVLAADARTDLATKADIEALRLATKADVAGLQADVNALRLTTKADLEALRSDLIKWNVGALAVLTAIFAAIVRLG